MSIDFKLHQMLEMQHKFNTQIHPNWRGQSFPWYRAIWLECAELMDHTDWKWWKHQEVNTRQIHLELVDIWHFGLSWVLQRDSNQIIQMAHYVIQSKEPQGKFNFTDPHVAIENFAEQTLRSKSFAIADFMHLKNACNLSFDGLYKLYIGKNVLNVFRQDNGYADGKYVKTWNGVEDNDVMMDLAEKIDASTFFELDLRKALEDEYRKIQ